MKLNKTVDTAPGSDSQPAGELRPHVQPGPDRVPAPVDPRLLAATRDRFSTGTDETVPQSKLVLMCFERIARDLRQAQESMTAGRHFDAHTNLIHAQDIVMVLRDALDVDAFDGGPGLQAVYDWSISQLTLANAKKDTAAVGLVASSLAEIGTAFEQAAAATRAALPSAPTGSDASGLSVKA